MTFSQEEHSNLRVAQNIILAANRAKSSGDYALSNVLWVVLERAFVAGSLPLTIVWEHAGNKPQWDKLGNYADLVEKHGDDLLVFGVPGSKGTLNIPLPLLCFQEIRDFAVTADCRNKLKHQRIMIDHAEKGRKAAAKKPKQTAQETASVQEPAPGETTKRKRVVVPYGDYWPFAELQADVAKFAPYVSGVSVFSVINREAAKKGHGYFRYVAEYATDLGFK